jgi:hypothetical protein
MKGTMPYRKEDVNSAMESIGRPGERNGDTFGIPCCGGTSVGLPSHDWNSLEENDLDSNESCESD